MASTMSAPKESIGDPFLTHLVALLSVHELGTNAIVLPYTGPSTYYHDSILRSITAISNRMHTAEAKLDDARNTDQDARAPSSNTGLNAALPVPAASDSSTALSYSGPDSQLPAPISPVAPSKTSSHDAAGDQGVEESVGELARLLIQLQDVARVCRAVACGDLTQEITADIEGGVVGELKGSINTIVTKLSRVASEVSRVALEVGTKGILGGEAVVPDVEGTWADLTNSVNSMARNLTHQVRAISAVAQAVATGDISETVNIQVEGEMLELKDAVNTMVLQLSNFSLEVSRVTGEIGTKGVLGGQAVVPGVQGAWEELRNDVNTMAHNLTKQVRAISEVARAVALGDISQTVDVHVEGEMLELKQSVNTMVLQLGAFSSSVMHVALEVGTKGVLGGQAVVPGVHGTWADLTESFNTMVSNLTTQVRAISVVTKAIAAGDKTMTVDVQAEGEMLELKNTVNTMVR